jgi:hypothetical protein
MNGGDNFTLSSAIKHLYFAKKSPPSCTFFTVSEIEAHKNHDLKNIAISPSPISFNTYRSIM